MNIKIKRICDFLKEKKIDALIIINSVNVSYLTGSPIRDAYLLFTKNKNMILTDFRYILEASKLKDFILEKVDSSFIDTLISLVRNLKLKKIGFEGEKFSYSNYMKIKKSLKDVILVDVKDFIDGMRMIKEKHELNIIEEAIKISKATFSYIKKRLKEGISEKELAKYIDIYIRSHGGESVAFPTIVASGPNAARPHAIVTDRKIKAHEPIIIDFGVRLLGYNSDLTRTLCLGKMSSKFYKIYNIVKTAQAYALSYIKPGRLISEVDRVARSFIAKAGFGEQFGHALGHGIGREVHESPKIFKSAKKTLLPNMVFTVEPAIYIPGWGGVRIEDMVLVTQKGCKILTDDIDKSI